MGERKEDNNYHMVEIGVFEEEEKKTGKIELSTKSTTMADLEQHPMMELSRSPGHLLQLKLWQREEDIFGRRISGKETRLDKIQREIFKLCCLFILFHAFFSTILFISSSSGVDFHRPRCRKWWIPAILAVVPSVAIVGLVGMKLFRCRKVRERLQREKEEGRAVTRCIQELRMKGASFDLCNYNKDPMKKKKKSSQIVSQWDFSTWFSQYLLTLCLVAFTAALAFPAPKLFLCVF